MDGKDPCKDDYYSTHYYIYLRITCRYRPCLYIITTSSLCLPTPQFFSIPDKKKVDDARLRSSTLCSFVILGLKIRTWSKYSFRSIQLSSFIFIIDFFYLIRALLYQTKKPMETLLPIMLFRLSRQTQPCVLYVNNLRSFTCHAKYFFLRETYCISDLMKSMFRQLLKTKQWRGHIINNMTNWKKKLMVVYRV